MDDFLFRLRSGREDAIWADAGDDEICCTVGVGTLCATCDAALKAHWGVTDVDVD